MVTVAFLPDLAKKYPNLGGDVGVVTSVEVVMAHVKVGTSGCVSQLDWPAVICERHFEAFPRDLSLGIHFPSDMSLENVRWRMLDRDTFPSDNPKRNGRSHIIFSQDAIISVKLLGRAVSRDAYFISGLVMRRAVNAVDLMGLLSQLHDPQSELLLLRSCMGIAKLFFGLRTCQPVHMEEADLFFDKGLLGSIENMVVCGEPFFGDLQWRLASLPIRFTGLGLYSAKVASSYTFVASRGQSWVLIDHILRDSSICGMDDDYVFALD
nr:reverse transcriptase domain-containing protein [Tanacetum cinerariifolium]